MQPSSDIEERNLMALLESFGSSFSLDDIASAYCEANGKVDMAAEILCASSDELKGASEPITLSSSAPSNRIAEHAKVSSSASEFPKPLNGKRNFGMSSSAPPNRIAEHAKVSSSASEFPKPLNGKRNSGAVKSKPHPASFGIVSGVVGKHYIQHKTLTVPYQEVKNKPLKLDAEELPESEIWGERNSVSAAAAGKVSMGDDVVNFLFKMLGDGFELDKDKIHGVLGLCGYDVQQTMEKLLDMSASTLEKCDDVHGQAGENSRDQLPDVSSASSEEGLNPIDLTKRDEYRVGIQKEILETLFSFPQRSVEVPKRRRPVRATSYGIPVVRKPEDTPTAQSSTVVESQSVKEESDDDENSYKVLRRAVKEYWTTMKEYYKAAVDAFAKGDYARAERLLEQGRFYNRKAREADEKSSQKLLQTNDNDNEIPLDLSVHEPKDALSLLKIHLTSLCGIHAFKYIRVIVGTGDEDRKGTKKRLIIRQLEKNSIQWTEEDNGRALRLQVDAIDPRSLSFAQKN